MLTEQSAVEWYCSQLQNFQVGGLIPGQPMSLADQG